MVHVFLAGGALLGEMEGRSASQVLPLRAAFVVLYVQSTLSIGFTTAKLFVLKDFSICQSFNVRLYIHSLKRENLRFIA